MNIIEGLLCKPTFCIKSMASLAEAYLLNIQSKVFLVTLLSTPKEGNPTIQQTLAENLPFPFPLEGAGGVNTIKSFRSSERWPMKSPCMLVAFAFAQARANKCRCKINKGGRGLLSLTLSTPGEPLKQVLVPLSVGRGLFFIGDLSMSSTNRQKNFQKGGVVVKLFTVLPQ